MPASANRFVIVAKTLSSGGSPAGVEQLYTRGEAGKPAAGILLNIRSAGFLKVGVLRRDHVPVSAILQRQEILFDDSLHVLRIHFLLPFMVRFRACLARVAAA
jgi:hypothetical protein